MDEILYKYPRAGADLFKRSSIYAKNDVAGSPAKSAESGPAEKTGSIQPPDSTNSTESSNKDKKSFLISGGKVKEMVNKIKKSFNNKDTQIFKKDMIGYVTLIFLK